MKKQLLLVSALIMGLATINTGSIPKAAHAKGGKTPPVQLPADWPKGVPLPVGTLQQVVDTAPHWIAVFIAQDSYPNVMSGVRKLYLGAGFREPNPVTSPYTFTNGSYQVTVVAAARDHSASQTNVYVHVIKLGAA